MDNVVRYISLGAGAQSTVLTLMAEQGLLGTDAPSLAVFADTGAEPPNVYEHLDWLESEAKGVEIVRVHKSNLAEDVMRGVNQDGAALGGGAIPSFTKNFNGKLGITPRQCTSRYKIEPIEKYLRGRYGNPYPGRMRIESWMGISADEVYRVKDDRRKSYSRKYPLIDLGMKRTDCERWFAARWPDRELPRSACWFCPFHSAEEWVRVADKFPDLHEKSAEMDALMRTRDAQNLERFLHRRRLPFREAVEIDRRSLESSKAQMPLAISFADECEGVCGV